MLGLSRRALGIAPSATLSIDARAKELRAQGMDVVGFGAGEPDFDTPEYIREAAKRAIDEGKTRYTPVAGTLSLRKKIAEKFLRDNGLSYTPDQILVSSGAKQSLFNAFSVLLNEGDEVLIPQPYWVSYPEMVKMVGGVPVFVATPAEEGFRFTAKTLEPFVTARTKALILNSPNNPNGFALSRDALEGIARLAVEKQFYVVSDEIYEKLIYDGEEHVSIASLGEDIYAQTIVVNGVSKTYAMTGWRIGYAAGPKEIIKRMSAFQSHASSNANSIAQYATEAALSGGEDYLAEMVREFDARRTLLYDLVAAAPGLSANLPKGAFYMMVNVKSAFGKSHGGKLIQSSTDFAALLLEEKHVAVVPGEAFGEPGHVRLSYATSRERIQEGIRRMAEFMGELQ
ncbi:MAG TPA: pyridoxal phosphate-dependent aminotransferase [Candidatus Pullichristensenella excrementigallinarum]|uniref:Aminotransferase n=1 Tax=Candidatus Pullichristensenella excrementigallinarum TaxID=2840907 RepID=A0A9D1LBX5_9FIRM|nr:pyridoxal phosphate-dependent aminotransferase [Candidatus Pullichristensenella excrementigallinarum]